MTLRNYSAGFRMTSRKGEKGNMNFGSDNAYGVHQKILDAINDANASLTDEP
jgi:hypothetical protein